MDLIFLQQETIDNTDILFIEVETIEDYPPVSGQEKELNVLGRVLTQKHD